MHHKSIVRQNQTILVPGARMDIYLHVDLQLAHPRQVQDEATIYFSVLNAIYFCLFHGGIILAMSQSLFQR